METSHNYVSKSRESSCAVPFQMMAVDFHGMGVSSHMHAATQDKESNWNSKSCYQGTLLPFHRTVIAALKCQEMSCFCIIICLVKQILLGSSQQAIIVQCSSAGPPCVSCEHLRPVLQCTVIQSSLSYLHIFYLRTTKQEDKNISSVGSFPKQSQRGARLKPGSRNSVWFLEWLTERDPTT